MVMLRNRREVLRIAGSVVASALLGAGDVLAARSRPRQPRDRKLSLYALHTGERLAVTYYARGAYQADALDAVNRLLRDHQTDEKCEIDAALLDQLHRLHGALGSRATFHVVCGYRSAETNARARLLRPGVAEHSLHIEGRAVDLYLPDRSLEDLRTAALALRAGGVGYYPVSNFVHLDTGPVRTWCWGETCFDVPASNASCPSSASTSVP
jgi:uncharacterized protein YcbK (DUF882 family)